MKKLLLSQEFQVNFLKALHNNSINNWYQSNEWLILKVSKLLRKVKVPKDERYSEKLYKLILKDFDWLFSLLWTNPDNYSQGNSAESVFIDEIVKCRDQKNWKDFWNRRVFYFDKILTFARKQDILNVRIEGDDRNQYLNFSDAIKNQNAQKLWKEKKIFSRKRLDQKYHSGVVNNSDLNMGERFPSTFEFEAEKIKHRDNKSKHEELEVNDYKKQLQKIVESPSKMSEPVHLKNEVPRVIHFRRSESDTSIVSWSTRKADLDRSFMRKLNYQNGCFEANMKQRQEARERMNREAADEMRKIKEEYARRMQMFVNCLHLKLRWEEQEEEWSYFLKSIRDPVINLKNKLFDFGKDHKTNSEEENKWEADQLIQSADIAYYNLIKSFEKLSQISSMHQDKLFLKVVQSKISSVATKVCLLLDELEEFQNNKEFYKKIKHLDLAVNPHEIPSTSKLREICKSARPDDFNDVPPPKQPQSYCVVSEV